MAAYKFECDECGNEGTIKYKPVESRFEALISFCPFCGADISQEEDEDYEE